MRYIKRDRDQVSIYQQGIVQKGGHEKKENRHTRAVRKTKLPVLRNKNMRNWRGGRGVQEGTA